MKLVNKFTLSYMAITTLVLVLGGVIIFNAVEEEIDKEESFDLRDLVENTAIKLKKGHPLHKVNRLPVEVKELDPSSPLRPFEVRDTVAMHEQLERPERQLKASQSFKIDGRHYYISVYNTVVESDDIVEAVVKSLSWIFLILLLLVVVTDRIVSKKILRPFHQTLEKIKTFNIKNKEPVKLGENSTAEFNDLNTFLEKMMQKATDDYLALKEFTENASHEMQTPLAIIRGKLELLLDTDLSPQQAANITASLAAVERLTRTGKSLTLLTKLENREYEAGEEVDVSERLEQTIASLAELVGLKELTLEQAIEKGVKVKLHPVLADMLLTNLMSNAIRHNLPAGFIQVTLTPLKLTVRNTGPAPELPTGQLFQRFKKGNHSNDSVGLGLAIAKQICEMNNLQISYSYNENIHTIQVTFPPK